ncbi:MAG TPA: SH3 domain-containing protein [Alphaproteobacteria bacterium]|nr:SH3 domain-containing protein [Alphaproteobacteria bacterium]
MKSLIKSLAVLAALLLAAAPAAAEHTTGTPAWSIKPLTLYEGPGSNYDVTGSVEGKLRIYVDRCSNNWCRIHVGREHGWAALSRIAFGREPVGPLAHLWLNYNRNGPGTVCFYEGHDYTGYSLCGGTGYAVHDLLLMHLDNRFSSVSIEGNVSVMACRDRDFKSYCEHIDASEPALQGFLDNGVSSFQIY